MERNYGVDLLRIIAMYMVVVLHLLGGGEILEYFSLCSLEYEAAWVLELIAFPAVNCYALISGYVSVDAKYGYSNIIMLWLQVCFYTVLIPVSFFVCMPNAVDLRGIVSGFFPILTNQYWYFTAYVGVFLFMPGMRIIVNKMSQKDLKRMLAFGFALLSVCPVIANADIFNTANGYSMLWLCYLFLVGAYIKKYNVFMRCKTRDLILICFGCLALTLGIKFVIEYVSWNYFERLLICDFMTRYTSPLILVEAMALLIVFSRIQLGEFLQKIVRKITPLVFGIYLIHNHQLMRVNFIVYT